MLGRIVRFFVAPPIRLHQRPLRTGTPALSSSAHNISECWRFDLRALHIDLMEGVAEQRTSSLELCTSLHRESTASNRRPRARCQLLN